MMSRLFRSQFCNLLFLINLSLVCPTSFSAEAGDAIVIGQAIDLSSQNGSIGRDYVAGIKTFFDALNAAGGLNGRHVRYIVRDDQGKSDLATKATTELIERDHVDYLLGGVGDRVTQAVLNTPAFRQSNLVLYAPLVDAIEINDTRVLFWRPAYLQEIRHILTHFGQLGMRNIGIAYQDAPATQAAFRMVSAELKSHGLALTGTARIGNQAAQNEQEAAKLAMRNPEFVIVIADTISSALFLKSFRNHATQTFVAGTSLTNLETLRQLAGSRAVEWTVFSQVVPNPNNAKTQIQLEHMKMMQRYRDEPMSPLTLEGFAVAKTLVKAIQRTKKAPLMAMQDLLTQHASIDLGGLIVSTSEPGQKQSKQQNNHLSRYLDIALFKKNALVF